MINIIIYKIMTEPKLEPIKKEKIDSMFSDEKETSKKNKKKTKAKNKKKNQMDLFDYAKENGLDINIQYEDIKPVDFDFAKKNFNNNNKTNQTYNKDSNIEKNEKKVENKEKEKENNKKEEKKKNNENKKENNKKKFENNNEENNEEDQEENYDKYKYDEYFKNDNNYFKEQSNQNYNNKNYYNNYNNNYNNNKNYNNKKNYNNYYIYKDYNNNYNNNYKKKNNIAVEIPDNKPQSSESQSQNNSNNNLKNQNQVNNFNNIQNNGINQINIQNNIFNQYYQANLNLMSNYQAEMMRMNYYSNMENLNSNLYSPQLYMPMTNSSTVEMLEKYFSLKNLNKDINLRKNMDEETGNVPLDFILNLNKIKSMNLTEENISQFIDDIGSDIIEVVKIDNISYIRPKNYESMKNGLISIEEIEEKLNQKNKNQNIPAQNMQIGMPQMFFYPVQPMMYYNQMMSNYQQNAGNQPGMANQSQNNDEGSN